MLVVVLLRFVRLARCWRRSRPILSRWASRLPLSRTAVLYGGWLPSTDIPMSQPTPTLELTPGITGRLLYLVGADDSLIDARQRGQIQAALTAARHCQQVLGGIGFTAEHGLHRHVRRALVLDGLLGSARELTREAGALLVKERSAQRLVYL